MWMTPACFTTAQVKAAYKSWVSVIIRRNNTITGRRYADEPAILSWEPMNEVHTLVAAPNLLAAPLYVHAPPPHTFEPHNSHTRRIGTSCVVAWRLDALSGGGCAT